MKSSTATAPAWTALTTVLAPLAWGTTYVTVTELLPAGRPLFVAAMRVVPAGVVLVLVSIALARRQGRGASARWRPEGAEWGRTAVLSITNFGLFFPLLVVAVYRLPGGVAAAVGGLQPITVASFSWIISRRQLRVRDLVIGAIAAVGVALVVIRPGADIDPIGVGAAVAANLSFSVGVVLTKHFPSPANRLSSTGWQLLMSGAALVPLALLVEGSPAAPSIENAVGFAYLSLIGTALAFVLWFNGVRRLPAAAPPLLGLAAPVMGATAGWVVLGQGMSTLQLTGFVITLGAITYGATMRGPEASRHRQRFGRPRRCARRPSITSSVKRTTSVSRGTGSRPASTSRWTIEGWSTSRPCIDAQHSFAASSTSMSRRSAAHNEATESSNTP
ncbi:MAG TPA: EamA family transporter [Ilumatobacteraceae bacterium]